MTVAIDALSQTMAHGLWSSTLWFVLAVVLVDAFDISVPRGDSIGVSGAICAAAVIVLAPLQALAVSMAPSLLSWLVRSPRRTSSAITLLGTRGFATVLAIGVNSVVGPPSAGTALYVAALLVPAVYLAAELSTAQSVLSVRLGRPLARLLLGNFARQAPLLLAQVSAAALIALTYEDMREWTLIPVVALLLLMRQSYSLLLEIRDAYRTTVELLVEAAEAQDPRRVGHSERTASIARAIAMKMGLPTAQVELVSYAALLHDLDAIALDEHGLDSETVDGELAIPVGHSSDVLEGIEFFADVVPILRLCDGVQNEVEPASEDSLMSAFVVALASDVDTAENWAAAFVHSGGAVERVPYRLSPSDKALAVAAAVSLGFEIPAVR